MQAYVLSLNELLYKVLLPPTSEEQLENTKLQLETAKSEAAKPFPQEEELRTKSARLDDLNIELNMDRAESELLDSGPETEDAEISQVERCAVR